MKRVRQATGSCKWMALALIALAGCSQDIQPPTVRNLDRPSEVAFTCYGDLVVNGGDPGAEGTTVVSAQPPSSCLEHASGDPPEGQEGVVEPDLYGFVLQSGRGTVAAVNLPTRTVLDADPLTPGKNSIPVGTLPVGITADRSSCHMVVANGGSCDLSHLEVNTALDPSEPTTVARVSVVNASGERLLAKPRAIAGEPPEGTIGVACPEEPEGITYVAYPGCNLVAAVEAGTGQVVGGVTFDEDGNATITDGEVTCPDECTASMPSSLAMGVADAGVADAGLVDAGGDGGAPDAGMPPPPPPQGGPPRPVALHMEPDGSRLYIGAENSSVITIVELDEDRMPAALESVALEGQVGVTEIAVSDVIEMGGEPGSLEGSAGEFKFAYAVATDNTVRVVEVEQLIECDTQVDPRYLHEEQDVAFLSCMPVGGPDTPPRRAGATSPGIRLPRGGKPLDVAFAAINSGDEGDPSPTRLIGYFAFVTSTEGFVFVVNVDDDNYPDFEKLGGDSADPAAVYMPLAIAHQLRDLVVDRNEIEPAGCGNPVPERLQYGARLAQAPGQVLDEEEVVLEQFHHLPFMRQVECIEEGQVSTPVSELSIAAPVDRREQVFPDLAAVKNEEWQFTWEGALSVGGVGGSTVRTGALSAAGGQVALVDESDPFCAMGVEEFDIVAIVGCDPARGDADCGIGETCYVHPDSSTAVQDGICIPSGTADQISGVCRDFLITERRFTVKEALADRLVLGERRKVLQTTPLDGCESSAQCQELAKVERQLVDPAHPVEQGSQDDETEASWACEEDPTRRPGPPRCLMTCEETADCEAGFACSGGYCVEGVLPPAECLRAVQRYTVRVGDAFAVVGEQTGFLHGRTTDPDTGECIADPEAHPLEIGRLPLRAPPCEGDGLADLSPNPCSTTVTQTEEFIPYSFDPETRTCTAQPLAVREREAPAVRFRNPMFTFHMIDTETQSDQVCRADLMGDAPPFSAVYPGYQVAIELTGGYFPMFITTLEAAFPITVTPAPDGQIWILDQGDASSVTKGRVFTLEPGAAAEGFQVFTIL